MKIHRQLMTATLGMMGIVIVGTIGFKFFENISYFDALWMTMITVLTVGYGDTVPHTVHGRIFALIITPIGIGLATYFLGLIAAMIIEGEFSKTVGRRKMERAMKQLKNHVIVCGYGRVGQQVIVQLQREQVPFVIIDQNASNFEDLRENAGDILFIEGDASEDEVLKKAGIHLASGLVAALPQDSDNVFISLTAKGMNPDIQIVARAEKTASEEKMRRAGADKVINPASIGGRRMAMTILKPASVDYVDTLLHSHQEEYRVEEMKIEEDSPFANNTIKNTHIREKFEVTIVAIKRGQQIISNPNPNETLRVNDVAIVFGSQTKLAHFEMISKSKG